MEKKSFLIILSVLALTFLATTAIKNLRLSSGGPVTLDKIPLSKGEWTGETMSFSPSIVDLLSPDQLFSALFNNRAGNGVQLFVDYFSAGNTAGAIHSPRNCLPGSGWVITDSSPRTIITGGRKIPATRFYFALGDARQIMDFWYITRHGETSNDYTLKLNTMISSLTLQPTDKAFVRFVTANNPQSVAAMEDFENLFTADIYGHLPF